MNIYCIGNTQVPGDNLPPKMVSFLIESFPDARIIEVDPTENFTPEEGSILIDSVEGIAEVQMFADIDSFATTQSVSVHDFDLIFHLRMLKKLHKLKSIMILGVPRFGDISVIQSQIYNLIYKNKRGA